LAPAPENIRGQWAPVQSFQDFVADNQALANGMLAEVEAADDGAPMQAGLLPPQPIGTMMWQGQSTACG